METMIFKEEQFGQIVSSLLEIEKDDPDDELKLIKKFRIALIQNK